MVRKLSPELIKFIGELAESESDPEFLKDKRVKQLIKLKLLRKSTKKEIEEGLAETIFTKEGQKIIDKLFNDRTGIGDIL